MISEFSLIWSTEENKNWPAYCLFVCFVFFWPVQNKNVFQAYLSAKNIIIKLRHRKTNSRRKGKKIMPAPNYVLLRFFFSLFLIRE